MDAFIIFAAKFLGYIVILAALGWAIWGCLYVWLAAIRSAVGAPVAMEALRAYRKARPDRFKTFDRISKQWPP